jgi:spoIIIJ-associated protein
MSEPKPSLEIIAPSIEEAITRGAEEFGIPREELSVEILDEGTRGFLGLGTRQARVRLTIREGYEGEIPELPEVITEVEQVVPVPDVRVEEPESDDAEALEISKSTVVELLDKMGIVAEVTARWGEKDDKSRIIPLHIDVEGYRARREQQLRQLARRMAQQTIERGRSMSLEPMPPNERRIIHIELRDHPQVYTESVGEADRRKVTILLRQEQD